MKYLSISEVLFIHDQAIKRFGGSFGLRDIGLLESALARPQASYEGQDLYPTIFDKAAPLIHSLLKNHPFIDGNKPTAIATTGLFLKINGYQLQNMHQEEITFTLEIENNNLSIEEISLWLKKHTKNK